MTFAVLGSWTPPSTLTRLVTLDAHTAGEPLRLVIDGIPSIPGATMLERRRFAREHLDFVRTALLHEPRGHREMYGCLLTPPVTPGAHFGVLFMHNEGYSTMCGHGIIAVAMLAVETGLVPRARADTEVRIDTPAGLVVARVLPAEGGRHRVAFRNVPSFALALDERVEVPGLGWVSCDLAFGGAFYAYVDATPLGLRGAREEHGRLVEVGTAITRAVAASRPIRHPDEPDLGFLYGTIIVAPAAREGVHSRHVCVFAEGQVDRSPTGTGVSGRLALLAARGLLEPGSPIVIDSVIGSRFEGSVVGHARVGPHPAVVPEVIGDAYITGRHEFLLDPADPLKHGFFLG